MRGLWITAPAILGVLVFVHPWASNAQTTVTTTGGTSGKVAKFTGSSTIGDSVITEATGKIGIAIANPSYTLHVNGSLGVGSSSQIVNHLINSDSLELNNYGSGNRYAYVDLHGDDTYTDFGLRLLRMNNGANSDSYLVNRGTGVLRVLAQDAGSVRLATSNLDRLTVDLSGNVGIGTTSPSYRLQVNGTFRVNDSGSDGDTSPFLIDSSGNVAIGATSTAGYKLYVSGLAVFLGGLQTATGAGLQVDGSTLNVDASGDMV